MIHAPLHANSSSQQLPPIVYYTRILAKVDLTTSHSIMQDTANTRKRPAPGASTMVQQPNMQQQSYAYQQLPDNMTDFNNFDFNSVEAETPTFPANPYDSNNYSYGVNNSQTPTYGSNIAPAPSTELVRRNRNQALAPANLPQQQDENWNGFGQPASMSDEDEADLDVRVGLAKKDAQGKRKQIPPFVQKLSR